MGLQVFRVRTAAFAEEWRAPGTLLESQGLRQNVQDRSHSRSEIRASRGKPVTDAVTAVMLVVMLLLGIWIGVELAPWFRKSR